MSLAFYLDDNIGSRAIVAGLTRATIEVETSDASGNRGKADQDHLRFAAERGLVLVTADRGDFAAPHWAWVNQDAHHSGIVLVPRRASIGDTVRALIDLDTSFGTDGLSDQLVYLPARPRG